MTEYSQKKQNSHTRLMLVLLAAVFIVPILIAWIMYQNLDSWWSGTTANHGELITPARPIPDTQLHNAKGEPFESDFLKHKWTLIIFSPEECDPTCRENLYKTRQIRILLKRDQVRVQRLYITSEALPQAVYKELKEAHSDLLVARVPENSMAEVTTLFEPDHKSTGGSIYLVDPLGNYMMRYPPEASPKMMLQDMKRLLEVSRVG